MSKMDLTSTIELNDGNTIPRLGLGVFQMNEPEECAGAVATALQAGYRHIDTAHKYENEQFVGNGLKNSGIPREDIFLTTKSAFDHSGTEIRKVFDESLKLLQTDYVDLFLIHWPLEDKGLPGAWNTLVKMKEEGLCRSVGVSNISIKRFEEILYKENTTIPTVNQMELHVYNQQKKLVDYCTGKGMVMQAYSSLAQGKKLSDPGQSLLDIADQHFKSVVQVMIRFLLQKDIVTLVKSKSEERIKENADVFDFELTADEMATLTAMDQEMFVRDWAPDGYY